MKIFGLFFCAAIFMLVQPVLADKKENELPKAGIINETTFPQTIFDMPSGNNYKDGINIGYENFSKRTFAEAFLVSAISQHYRADGLRHNMMPYLKFGWPEYSEENLKTYYPWLYPLVYPQFYADRVMRITKWEQPITISFGYPNNLESYGEDSDNVHFLKILTQDDRPNEESKKIIEDQVKSRLEELQKMTGLPMSFEAKEEKKPKNPAKLRIIVITRPMHWPTNFKSGGGASSTSWGYASPEALEYRLGSFYAFTPGLFDQLSGYIVHDKNNAIQFAVCKIWQGHPPEMLKALTDECLIRALGFPEILGFSAEFKSILAPYNSFKDSPLPVGPKISELDAFMVRTLYSPKVKAGMTIREFIEMFYSEE